MKMVSRFALTAMLVGLTPACTLAPTEAATSGGTGSVDFAAKPGKADGGSSPDAGPTLDYSGYTLVWSDEFDGPSLDGTIWTPEIGNGTNGWGNNELEYYRSENARVQGGVLLIEAVKEAFNGYDYTSARIKTQGAASFQYGIVEARIKSPTGPGLWPAFWMLGNDFSTVGWPYCGEVDIMENKGSNTMYEYAHWFNDATGVKSSDGSTTSADISQYHVYSIRWDASALEWYIDGVQHHRLDVTPSSMSEFHQPFFILLNLAVGGNFPGSPRKTTIFPATLEVDWVRVYQ